VVYEGNTVDADEMQFEVIREFSLELKVSDGSSIELKQTVKTVYRLCDQRKADGSPIYLLTGAVLLNTTPGVERGTEEKS
jgi:hypothetical protein